MTVQIFALNYNFFCDLKEDYLEEGQKPILNHEGEQYVAVWHAGKFFGAFDFPSDGYLTLNEARQYAESVVKKVIRTEKLTKHHI